MFVTFARPSVCQPEPQQRVAVRAVIYQPVTLSAKPSVIVARDGVTYDSDAG